MERPKGVIILAILNLLAGILGIISSLLFLLFGSIGTVGGFLAGQADFTGTSFVMVITAIIGLVNSILSLGVSYGLFAMKNWAWAMAVVIQFIYALTYVTSLLNGKNILGSLISLGIAGFILYYLYQPNVKQAFRISPGVD
ncbi:hypothetical protein cce_3949 [Crocosphaera subtropica ATCC 51142]|uniref:Uncharacterized protein n=1 Tax=Crocosphaera subtropica (strain ATCC 51142 / BH68) TaxID=43989 RepID=B1WPY2_CROS5|nr:hypothetical protein [Crocosphaera subtropica]ACB53297.1 hypothetical protein cce_3949 [Crocosphaera subtropica ATCC 51142]